jgi:ferritin
MINEKIEQAFNKHMTVEMHSAYLYLAMGAYFDSVNYGGFAKWMKTQAKEEIEHAMKFYKYLNDRGGRARFGQIDEPQGEWDSPLAVFEDAYKHEQKITKKIHDLVRLADKEDDVASGQFLQWFVQEQVEEEANTGEMVEHLKMLGGSPNGVFMVNVHAGRRGE